MVRSVDIKFSVGQRLTTMFLIVAFRTIIVAVTIENAQNTKTVWTVAVLKIFVANYGKVHLRVEQQQQQRLWQRCVRQTDMIVSLCSYCAAQ